MPIGQPFNLQFKLGDVVYGMGSVRNRYVRTLPETLGYYMRPPGGQYVYLDAYNNNTFGDPAPEVLHADPMFENPDFRLPDTKRAILRNLESNRNTSTLNSDQKTALARYYDALQKTKYAPLEAVSMDIDRMIAKGNHSPNQLVFRRACKFGLEYVIDHLRSTIHFFLNHPQISNERLNFRDIVNKKLTTGSDGPYVQVTFSELRFCYRNRYSLMSTGRLKFYFNLLEVRAPWVTDPDLWDIYEEHRITTKKKVSRTRF